MEKVKRDNLRKEYNKETGKEATRWHDGIEYSTRDYCAWLEKEFIALRESKSEVSSDREIEDDEFSDLSWGDFET